MPKHVIAVHDLPGFSHVALNAVIPIMTSLGVQVSPLASAILSTNAAYKGVYFQPTSEAMRATCQHWKSINLTPDAIYTGFLANSEQLEIILDLFKDYPACLKLVDPVMGDNGKLYSCFDHSMIVVMQKLISQADIICPNLTEMCLLAGEGYRPNFDKARLHNCLQSLAIQGPSIIIVSSVVLDNCYGTALYQHATGEFNFFPQDKIEADYAGSGDCFCSYFLAHYLQENNLSTAIIAAGQFVVDGIRYALAAGQDKRAGIPLATCLSKKGKI